MQATTANHRNLQGHKQFSPTVKGFWECRTRRFTTVVGLLVCGLCAFTSPAKSRRPAKPIQLHPANPHYFLWRDKPTVLITSGEHYGAVLNREFNYKKYLKTLQSHRFNLTRTFSGAYCEPVGAFKIKNNTLAPAKGKLICPWARSDVPGYSNGGNKFDLTRWDPVYFERLRDFVGQANKYGVVVELVLFCPFYAEGMWKLSPMNAANNINGIGKVKRDEVHTLKHAKLLAVQDAMIRKIVQELKGFDNVYYEICNEPYARTGQSDAWQRHIAETIVTAEADFKAKHLIAQNISNRSKKIHKPNPWVSIFNFHYAKPPTAVTENYGLNRVIADDETGFAGSEPKPYRIEAWDFIVAGGAVFDNLDYSFTVGHENGTAKIDAPGSGGPVLRKQLKVLSDFVQGFDFVKMKPDNSIIKEVKPKSTAARALVERGRAYAVYIHGGTRAELVLQLPRGQYDVEWLDTKTGDVVRQKRVQHTGGNRTLRSPRYADDIALRILATN